MFSTFTRCSARSARLLLILILILILYSILVTGANRRGTGRRKTNKEGRVKPKVRKTAAVKVDNLLPLLAICEPSCVSSDLKRKIQKCISKSAWVQKVYTKCTFDGTEICDQKTTKIINTCWSRNFKKKGQKLPQAVNDCMKSVRLSDKLNKCLKGQWTSNLKQGPNAKIKTNPRNPGQREVEGQGRG